MKNPSKAHEHGVIERIIGRTMRASDIIIGCLILVGILINFANVVGRYVFGSAISWAEEALIFITVWCVFLGAAASAWEDLHLNMDLFLSIMPSPVRQALRAFARTVGVAVGCVVVYGSWQVVSMMARFGQKSTSTEIPMAIPHGAITLGFALLVLALLCRGWSEWRRPKRSPETSQGAAR